MTPLAARLRERIARCGPIPVAEFMAAANGDPEHGYYARRDPLGRQGDFVTAPEISQMFGELIGAWCAGAWRGMNAPGRVVLVELGPGRGTLMADLLRATRRVAGFHEALDICLIETSPALARRQRETLAGAGVAAAWRRTLSEAPDGPLLLVANEFLDALPVEQYVARGGCWHRRAVDIGADGFRFVDGPPAAGLAWGKPACEGEIREANPQAVSVVGEIARRLAAGRGAALIVDYGHTVSAAGETLQAVARHRYADPLAAPGEADLSAHVDFAACAGAARAAGARCHGPVTQGAFLRRLGIGLRRQRLAAAANPADRAALRAACRRLTDPGAMGSLFKALAITDRAAPVPAGFEDGPQ